jgi:glycosyltransferase involved in cell wall biosynthesis/O-antigen/teichoic acid export membrane protein
MFRKRKAPTLSSDRSRATPPVSDPPRVSPPSTVGASGRFPNEPSVAIVIDNHNYGRFLADAVDSALAQTHPFVEVIVVDDGSTDDSRERLREYGGRVELVLKENGGQASALNAGAARVRSDVVIFLDADDRLDPGAAALVASAFRDHPRAVKAQYRLEVIDARGSSTGVVEPSPHLPLPTGDLRRAELTFPFDLVWMATSASAFRVAVLRRILPIPERAFAECPDWYLAHLMSLLGDVLSLDDVGAYRRVHGENRYETGSSGLDVPHLRQSIVYAAETAQQISRLAGELGLELPHDRILSVADLANRLISLKLEPERHPLRADRLGTLALDGTRAAWRRFDVSWPLKLVYSWWFGVIAVAPRPLAQVLARAFVANRPKVLAAALRPFHRWNRRSSSAEQWFISKALTKRAQTGLRVRAHLAAPLYRNAYFLIIGAGAGSLLGFVFWTVAARHYSAEFVGLNSVLISALMLVSGVCQLGLNAVLFRYVPGAGAMTRRLILRSYALSGALSVVAGMGAGFASGWWATDSGFLHDSLGWLLAFVVGTVAWTIYTLQDGALTGLRQARWVPVESLLASLLRIGLVIAFASFSPRGGIFLAWSVPILLLLAPVNVLILRRIVPRHSRSVRGASWDRGTVLRLAAGNYFGSLLLMASSSLLPIIVAGERGTQTTAYFYIPWTISIGLQLVAMNMTTSVTVEAAYDESKLRDYSRSATLHTVRLIAPAVAVLAVAAPEVLRAFGPDYAREGTLLLRLLALATIPNIVVAVGTGVARIHHDGRMALLIPGAASVLTIGLSALLLPTFGIEGVGWASLAAQLAVAAWLLLGMLRPVLFVRA